MKLSTGLLKEERGTFTEFMFYFLVSSVAVEENPPERNVADVTDLVDR